MPAFYAWVEGPRGRARAGVHLVTRSRTMNGGRPKHDRIGAPRMRVRAPAGGGFRPFVHGLARDLNSTASCATTPKRVLEVEGERVNEFVDALRREPPPLAASIASSCEEFAKSMRGFSIEPSADGRTATRIVSDAAVCESCLDDLFDPDSRFISIPSSIARLRAALHADAASAL